MSDGAEDVVGLVDVFVVFADFLFGSAVSMASRMKVEKGIGL